MGAEDSDREMSVPGPPSRISVSLETLRTEITLAMTQLELSLMGKLATKEDVEYLRRNLTDLSGKVQANEKWIAGAEPQLRAMQTDIDRAKVSVEDLSEGKAGQDAVNSYKRWLWGGSLIVVIFMAMSLALNIYVATHGHHGK